MPAVGDDKTVCPAWGEKIGLAAGGGSAAAGAGQLDSELAGEQLRRSWNNLHFQPGAQGAWPAAPCSGLFTAAAFST